MKARRDEAKRLAQLLGDDHDLAVLEEHLTSKREDPLEPDTIAIAVSAARRRSVALRTEARRLGAKLHAEKPEYYTESLRRFWRAGTAEHHHY